LERVERAGASEEERDRALWEAFGASVHVMRVLAPGIAAELERELADDLERLRAEQAASPSPGRAYLVEHATGVHAAIAAGERKAVRSIATHRSSSTFAGKAPLRGARVREPGGANRRRRGTSVARGGDSGDDDPPPEPGGLASASGPEAGRR
jgi:hypothetical protein